LTRGANRRPLGMAGARGWGGCLLTSGRRLPLTPSPPIRR